MRKYLLAVLLLVLIVGCTARQRETGARISETISSGAKVAAGVVAGTAAAPIAPVLVVFGLVAGVVARLLRNKGKEIVVMADKDKVVGFFGSRKNKLTAIGFIVAGLVTFAKIQWDLPESVCVALLGLVTIVTGANIHGISKEDAATKGNPNNGK